MSLNIDPVRICCGRKESEHSHGLCPTGTFMCQLCFGSFLPHQAWEDEDGQKWDICLNCKAHENFMLEVCAWVKAVQDIVDTNPEPTQG